MGFGHDIHRAWCVWAKYGHDQCMDMMPIELGNAFFGTFSPEDPEQEEQLLFAASKR